MSDEYQPNEVVESQPEPEAIPAESAPEEQPTTSGATPNAETTRLDDASAVAPTRDAQASDVVVVEGSIEAPREVKFDFAESPGPVVGETGASKPAPSLLNIAEISESRRANGQGIGGTLKRLGTNLKGRGWLAAFAFCCSWSCFCSCPRSRLPSDWATAGDMCGSMPRLPRLPIRMG